MNKPTIVMLVAAGALGFAGLAEIGFAYYSSNTLKSELETLSKPAADAVSDYQLRNLKHDAGIFASSGAVDLELRSHCDDGDAPAPVGLRVEYSVSHLPGLKSLNQFTWTLTPLDASKTHWKQLFGSVAALQANGMLTYGGLIRSDMQLPAIAVKASGYSLQVPASNGTLAMGKLALAFKWNFERMVLRGHGEAVELKQLALEMDLQNRKRGLGTLGFSMGSLGTSTLSMEGLKIASTTTEANDRLNSKIRQSVSKLQVAGQELNDLSLELAVNGVEAQSAESLGTLFSATCGFRNMTVDEGKRMRVALKNVLAAGFSVGVTQLTASSGKGSIDGRIMVELLPSKGAELSLADQLKSSASLVVKGNFVPDGLRDMALATGYVSTTADGLKTGYEFADGLVTVNGKTFDAGMVRSRFDEASQSLNRFLSTNPAAPVADSRDGQDMDEAKDTAPSGVQQYSNVGKADRAPAVAPGTDKP